MSEWNLPWAGGCRCGQVRLKISAPPLLTMACHCTGCQRMTASAFSLSAAIPTQGFAVTRGEPVIGGLHGTTQHFFCPHCMSWMFTRPEGLDGFVNVRSTMLDNARELRPFMETYTSEKLPGTSTGAVRGFPAFPAFEDYEKLTKEYAEYTRVRTHTPDGSSTVTRLSMPSDRELRTDRVFAAPPELVWRAMTEPALVARWWGRGHSLVIERDEVVRGGHWRYVEHAPEGVHGFEGRYREVVPGERLERTFEWDGLPGHVSVERVTLEDLGGGRTRLVSTALFFSTAERDGMFGADMEQGVSQSHAALDRVLASMR
jgi:uncharacterized protein YndB with AHSA1/START domain